MFAFPKHFNKLEVFDGYWLSFVLLTHTVLGFAQVDILKLPLQFFAALCGLVQLNL